MGLSIIGSGFGRTGTMSTKMALEQVGFGPCHHMSEVMQNPAQLAKWKSIASGTPVNWADVFAGYRAQVDWPGAAVWEQTVKAFPDAKVVHTERPENEWWNSFSVTIGKFFSIVPQLEVPPHIQDFFEIMAGWFMANTFADHADRATAIAAYRQNNQKVRNMVSGNRLLVFHVQEGWEPLCRFLNVPVPDSPFPRSNPRGEFWTHFGGEPASQKLELQSSKNGGR